MSPVPKTTRETRICISRGSFHRRRRKTTEPEGDAAAVNAPGGWGGGGGAMEGEERGGRASCRGNEKERMY